LEHRDMVMRRAVSPPPLLGSGRIALWSVTASGRAQCARQEGIENSAGRRKPGRSTSTADAITNYWVLAALFAEARIRGDYLRIASWEQPWTRTLDRGPGRRQQHVRFSAGCCLIASAGTGKSALHRVAILIDFGSAPVHSYQRLVMNCMRVCSADWTGRTTEVIVVTPDVMGSRARHRAWLRLFSTSMAQTDALITVRVLTWQKVAVLCPGIERLVSYATAPTVFNQGDRLGEVLALTCRHPYLTENQLAVLLGITPVRARRLLHKCIERGWITSLPPIPSQQSETENSARSSLWLVEVTNRGRRVAAQHSLLRAGAAARHQGVIAVRARRPLLRHLAHTVGTSAIFVAFAEAARAVTQNGRSDGLEEWRNAAACARGQCRPDGYGRYRRGRHHHGFFLEYDRGTERPREYAAKLKAYYRYRDSRASNRDFSSFPTILVVTTSPSAEERFAWQATLAARQRGTSPLRILFTTTKRISTNPEGILGPVWRSPDHSSTVRAYWLPENGQPLVVTGPIDRTGVLVRHRGPKAI
jgi:hypothetical protein